MSDANVSFDVSPQTFQADVIERSRQTPVLLLFWAEQVGPSAQTREILSRLVAQYQGKVLLGLVDVARDQTLAQHLRVQGLPSIRVVRDGQLTDQVDGPQPESVLKELLDALTLSPADALREQLAVLLERGELDTALGLLQQAVQEEPNNPGFKVELADVLILKGNLDDARTVLAGIPAEAEERQRPETRLALVEEAATLEGVAALEERQAAAPDDLEVRYLLAVRLAASGEFEPALEHAMAILRADRDYRDDLGRTTMLRIFAVLGKGSELATAYRRKMFNFMH